MGNFCSKSPEYKLSIQNVEADKKSPKSSVSRSPSCSSRGAEFNIREYYRLGRVLGSGQFGKVRKATSILDPTLEVAVKTIEKKKLRNIQTFITEVELLRVLDHPNIIKIYETFEDQNAYHMVMELCKGKELLDYLSDSGHFQEPLALDLFAKILSIVNYLHKHGVCHRDLKLENFVAVTNESIIDIKLIDFGLSKKFFKNKTMETVVGTPYYVAPEVLSGNYGEKCDLWSCGVILYSILSGKMPFNGWDNEDLLKQIKTSEIEFKGKVWEGVSEAGKDLCLQLLNRNVEKRLNAEQALQHPWLSKATQVALDLNSFCVLKKFKIQSGLQRSILYLISRTLKYEELKTLNNSFFSLDTKNEGLLDVKLVKKGVKDAKLNINEDDLQEYLNYLDLNGDGTINYTEFLIGTLHSKLVNDEKLILEAFLHFSKGTELINVKDLKESLLMVNYDFDQDNESKLKLGRKDEVCYEEFKEVVMRG